MNLNNESETSWGQIDFAESVDSMPYMSTNINIYKSLKSATEKCYYFAPKNLLVCDSATYVRGNRLNGNKHQMRFEIEMWDEQLQSMVVNYLRSRASNTNDKTIQSCNVRVVPFEQVKLVTLGRYFGFNIPTDWTSVGQSPRVVSFLLICDTKSKVKELIQHVRQHRSYFRHFKLLLRLKQDTRRQPIVIRVEDILAGNMMATLRQRFRNQVLLAAEDEEKLVMESTTRVLAAETFSDLETAQEVETEIANKITKLISSREIICDERSEVWNSVLWNDDNYRPDKLAMCLNSTEDFYELDVMDNVKKMNLIFWDTLSARTAFLKLAANLNIDLSRTETQSSLEFGKFCDEIQKHVMWNGERFVPKPLNLTRIYLEQDIEKELKVRIDFLTTAINVPDIGDNSLVEQPVRRWNDEFLTNPIIDILNRRRFTSRPNNNVYLKTGKIIPNSKFYFKKYSFQYIFDYHYSFHRFYT